MFKCILSSFRQVEFQGQKNVDFEDPKIISLKADGFIYMNRQMLVVKL